MKSLVLATVAAAALGLDAAPAHATLQIIAFGQTSGTNTVTGTPNGTDTATTIDATSTGVNITQIFGGLPGAADFSLNATSVDAVATVGAALLQHYNGTFCVTSAAGCGGINFLSGTFHDAAFGINGGTQLSVNVANPPDTLTLTSSVIAASNLVPPSSFTLSFSNVTPGLSTVGTTFAPFSASFSGVASANAKVPVPEVSSIAILGVGLLGLGLAYRRRRVS